jgi:plastocyanin
MKKSYVLPGIIFIVSLAVGAVIFIATATSPRSSGEVVVAGASSDASVHMVALGPNDAADPNTLAIKVGEYIQFNSNDGKQHQIAQGKGHDFGEDHEHIEGGLESGTFAADEAFKVQFKQQGTYFFHDNLNPSITISVVVYDPEHPLELK